MSATIALATVRIDVSIVWTIHTKVMCVVEVPLIRVDIVIDLRATGTFLGWLRNRRRRALVASSDFIGCTKSRNDVTREVREVNSICNVAKGHIVLVGEAPRPREPCLFGAAWCVAGSVTLLAPTRPTIIGRGGAMVVVVVVVLNIAPRWSTSRRREGLLELRTYSRRELRKWGGSGDRS